VTFKPVRAVNRFPNSPNASVRFAAAATVISSGCASRSTRTHAPADIKSDNDNDITSVRDNNATHLLTNIEATRALRIVGRFIIDLGAFRFRSSLSMKCRLPTRRARCYVGG